MLVSSNVSNLVNGVSQQAQNLRFTSQCDEQINGESSVLRGLCKRPGTSRVAELGLTTSEITATAIDRSATERYILTLGDRYAKVFTPAGTEIPVRLPGGASVTSTDLAYLAASTPTKSLKALTVADYTLLLNTEKIAALSPTVTPAQTPGALVFVRLFRTDTLYSIRLFNSPASTTPDFTFTASTSTATANQETIASSLRSALVGTPAANALYACFHAGPLLFIAKQDSSDFRIEVESGIPEGFSAFKDVAQSFASLPKKGWAGFQIKIKGDPETAGDDYFVRYVPQNAAATGFAEGTWEESQQLGLQDALDPTSLPHVLLNYGTHFEYRPVTWLTRSCGDATSNPFPSFIGRRIRDVFYFKNRLGLLADDNVILSEAGEFFNFWRTTVIQLLDSDPIDVGVGHTRVSILNSAVPSSERLVLFSEQSQFVLTGGDILTPSSASVTPASDFDNQPAVRPRALGNNLLFAFVRGAYSGFHEYGIANDTGLFTATNLTEHVPAYIPGEIAQFDTCELENYVFARTASAPDTLFVYRYFKQGGERLQASWSKWTFGGTVRSFVILGSKLYLLVLRGSATTLEVLDLDGGARDAYSAYSIRLDRKITNAGIVGGSYNADDDTTEFTLPYVPVNPRVVTRATVSSPGGSMLPVLSQTGDKITVNGNRLSASLWFGENYTMTQDLSRPAVRDKGSRGEPVIVPGRFQVRYGTLAYGQSLAFRVEVTPVGRPTFSYEFSPRSLGTSTALTGATPEPQDGSKRFPVFSKNDQVRIRLVNDSPLPCSLLSIDWEALWAARAQRV